MSAWPDSVDELMAVQGDLASLRPDRWVPPQDEIVLAGCFVCFERGPGLGAGGERAWAAASLVHPGRGAVHAAVEGRALEPYQAGLLALREGPLLEAAVRALPERPDVLLVNATGRDHPRKAGLALHLGAVLELPSVGVTDRTLAAQGRPPGAAIWSTAPLLLEGELVGAWLRTRERVRPVAVHAAWRTDVPGAIQVVRRASGATRTPGPIRFARQVARRARSSASG